MSSPENWNAPARLRSAPIDSCGKVLLQLLLDRQVGVEQVERLLREVAHLQAGAELDRARVGRQRAGDHLQQRRLAGAVLAHHAPALAAADRQVRSRRRRRACRTPWSRLERRDLVAGARRLRKSNFTTRRFFGSSIFSILSSALTRLCTCAALAACALKRSMKRCSLASIACWRA
jgi:hypothetical protein